jgi:hypothetical protein
LADTPENKRRLIMVEMKLDGKLEMPNTYQISILEKTLLYEIAKLTEEYQKMLDKNEDMFEDEKYIYICFIDNLREILEKAEMFLPKGYVSKTLDNS